ncbi:hypothetical protein K502DRAFT_34445 [Neoconidiobolus thromboides FSU 785]|nr:hypothetical protein K502DRAFT_34445 [Neoconidiobolus thromboides FSU 785]
MKENNEIEKKTYLYCLCCNGKLKNSNKLSFTCCLCYTVNDLAIIKSNNCQLDLTKYNDGIIELMNKLNLKNGLSVRSIQLLMDNLRQNEEIEQEMLEFIKDYIKFNFLNLDQLSLAFNNNPKLSEFSTNIKEDKNNQRTIEIITRIMGLICNLNDSLHNYLVYWILK